MLKQPKLNKWIDNSLVFLAPLAILYLMTIQGRIQEGGISLSDFYLDEKMFGAMLLYLINVLLDFFKKYKSDNK